MCGFLLLAMSKFCAVSHLTMQVLVNCETWRLQTCHPCKNSQLEPYWASKWHMPPSLHATCILNQVFFPRHRKNMHALIGTPCRGASYSHCSLIVHWEFGVSWTCPISCVCLCCLCVRSFTRTCMAHKIVHIPTDSRSPMYSLDSRHCPFL